MTSPGTRNLITDVDGVKVGQAHDTAIRTGVTVIRPDRPAVAGVHIRGGGPGTRETDLLDPANLVERVDAIVFSGGSVYGLEAASGVTAWLGAQGAGFPIPGSPLSAPIVPAAILFDLNNGGDKGWGEQPPYDRLGRAAVAATGADVALGNTGAGYGARAGAYKGGTGSASYVTEDGLQVGAIVAVNAFGSPVVPGTRRLWAARFAWGTEMGDWDPGTDRPTAADWPADTKTALAPAPSSTHGTSTTLGVVATNVSLNKAQTQRLAIMAEDGFARAIRPIHTPFDGDVLFALSTERRPLDDSFTLARLGTLAADCVTRAIGRAIYEARTLGTACSIRDTD
ncbi:MAG: P1 family peptidase [Alphaproteobacteria bacterium]